MKNFNFLLFTITVLISAQFNAQIGVDWVRNYGGSNNEIAYDSDMFSNGEIILLGRTLSNNGDIYGNSSTNGASWIAKMTPNGDTLWTKVFINNSYQQCQNIKVTTDNGFIIFNNESNNNPKTIKYSSNGIEQWSLLACYFDLIENNDGTFYGIKKVGSDCYLDNISASGIVLTSIIYTSCYELKPSKLFKASDGSFLVGSQLSPSNNCGLNSFTIDYETINIIKLSSTGLLLWQNTYGGSITTAIEGGESINNIKQLSDGSYLIAATSASQGNDVQGNHGSSDVWLFKLDNNGALIWSKCYGGTGSDYLIDLEINSSYEIYFTAGSQNISNNNNNGDHLINRVINSININGQANKTWLVKLTPNGDIIWQGQFGANNGFSSPNSLKIRNNGADIFIFGESSSATGNNIENNGLQDFWIMKFKPCNNILIPTINEVPITVNCSGFSSQLEVVNNANASYQWFTNSNGSYFELQGQNSNILNNNSLSQSTETYALLTLVNNCPVISSKTYQPTFVSLPQNQNICIVGLDQTTGKNKVIWEKEQTQVISSYNVYRENAQSSFDLIGSTNYSDSSLFLDIIANPIQQAYRYQITYTDTCGNESAAGSPHKTMHLTINQGVGTTWNLIWTPYSGIGYPSYNIYRGTNASNMTLLTTVASNITSYTDANAPSGFVYYQIEIVSPTNCNPTKSNYNNSRSNISTNDPSYLGVNENIMSAISIYPNPASNQITIGYAGQIQKVEIMDAKGAKVYSSIEHKKEIVLPSSLQTGFYTVLVHTAEGVFRKELVVNR